MCKNLNFDCPSIFEEEIFKEDCHMDNKLNVWIHSRVNNESERFLLEYQKSRILEFLDDMDLHIVGISQEISTGRDIHSKVLRCIRTHVRRGDIDVIVMSDKTRLLVSEDQYQEFKMLCDVFDVQLINLQEIEQTEAFFRSFLFFMYL